jgi:type I restriction enzyme M protein
MSKHPRDSEADAYSYIKEQLALLGWIVKNPARNLDGEVYRQNECLNHPEIKKALKLEKPEAVVKLSTSDFWVIESKRHQRQIDQALDEAKDYANKINMASTIIKALIVSGVAGNDTDTYIIKHRYWNGNQFVPITINDQEPTSLLSKEIVQQILRNKSPIIKDVPPLSEKFFLQKAEKINEILHNGAINLSERAKVIAALTLCYLAKEMPNRENEPTELINEINSRVGEVLDKQGKPEFKALIQLQLPPTRDNYKKHRNAIIQTFQELDNLNIRSAMLSNTDVLGKFYEVFLKYGNGAKEIGIVLTPRHITSFAAEVVGVTYKDILYDPTCGTAGFLVAAFDHVKQNSTKEQTDIFKRYNLFGLDQDGAVIALAIVNMIFRGDGRHNMHEGNCFQQHLVPLTVRDEELDIEVASAKFSPKPSKKKIVTKILMNPPFALKVEAEQEYKFVKYVLEEMDHGGVLFAVLPMSTMVESTACDWRRSILTDNKLLAVISFPDDLFYPISQNTVGIFIRKGKSQASEINNVLWCRAASDGYLKKKGKRLFYPNVPNDLQAVKEYVKAFIANPNIKFEDVPRKLKICPPDTSEEGGVEFAPEAYIDDKVFTEKELLEEMKKLYRENLAFKVRYGEQYVSR